MQAHRGLKAIPKAPAKSCLDLFQGRIVVQELVQDAKGISVEGSMDAGDSEDD